jgi:UDP-N-acetylglucosamine/UDP-N-acetylgalactosamine diphosphorylase
MVPAIDALRQSLGKYSQEHVLRFWDQLSNAEQHELLDQLRAIDLDELERLYRQKDRTFPVPASDKIEPVPFIPAVDPDQARHRGLGEEALRRGEVAAIVVAGGQGSRLGFEQPKGMYLIGPVSRKSLFQIQAEKLLAVRRRYNASVPLLIMTSPATDQETRQFYEANRYFGLPADEVFFFRQGTMPALDLATGKLLLESPGRLFVSPDGHGGTLTALSSSGLLDRLRNRGVKHLFYYQVDNPLIKIADPLFLGQHIAKNAQVSSKVIPKLGPTDKLGNFVQVDGRCTIIEYSDLPEELARQTDAQGKLRLWAGSPAIHIFDLAFLKQVIENPKGMPFHLAKKKVPSVAETGQIVQPEKENALKFERFIFDVLPLAERWLVVETPRAEEFAPLKNAKGADSPEAVALAMSNLAAEWLSTAGVVVPRWPDGNAAVALEINPLFALDAEELASKWRLLKKIEGPMYYE